MHQPKVDGRFGAFLAATVTDEGQTVACAGTSAGPRSTA